MRARVERGQTIVRAALLVAAVGLIGVLLYRQVSRMRETTALVWVTTRDLRAGDPVPTAALRQVAIRSQSGIMVNRAQIEGRALKVAKRAGDFFIPADLEPRVAPPALASTIPSGRVLATVKFASFDLPATELRAGDRLDMIVASDRDRSVRTVVRDAFVMGLLNSEASTARGDSGRVLGVEIAPTLPTEQGTKQSALVLALRPQDVAPLALAESGATTASKMKIVLHSTEDVKAGRTPALIPAAGRSAPVPAVEILRGSKKERVYAHEVRRRTFPVVSSSPSPATAPGKVSKVASH
jgi:hypothetical protein